MARIPSCCGCGVGPAAVALIQPLAWEPPYAVGAALKRPPPQKKESKECWDRVPLPPHSWHSVKWLSPLDLWEPADFLSGFHPYQLWFQYGSSFHLSTIYLYSFIYLLKDLLLHTFFSPPVLLRYNWHITLCKFKMYSVMIWNHTYFAKWLPQ